MEFGSIFWSVLMGLASLVWGVVAVKFHKKKSHSKAIITWILVVYFVYLTIGFLLEYSSR